MFKSVKDMARYFEVETIGRIPREIYNNSNAGIDVEFYTSTGKTIDSETFSQRKNARGITGLRLFATIEADAEYTPEVCSDVMMFPFDEAEFESAIQYIEFQTDVLWECYNNHPEGCDCYQAALI